MIEASALSELKGFFESQRKRVDASLDLLLEPDSQSPTVLHQAMRYSVFAGGKRVRPILALAIREALGGPLASVLKLAACLELIHTYSLIHDDLPAMDNDDFRRGLPTLHRKYGEGVAILAGNALLTQAFELLSELPTVGVDPALTLSVINVLCKAIGTPEGMISGQVVDLLTAGKDFSESELQYIHRSKTAALIRASVTSSALLCGSSSDVMKKMSAFGSSIGLVFQIVDDILDVEASSQDLGKTAGKDQLAEKATYPALYGIEKSRVLKNEQLDRAVAELEFLGPRGKTLRQIAHFIARRGH